MPSTSEFAKHWGLRPEVDFLNHGSFGATPKVVLEEQTRLRAALEREPVRFLARDLWNGLAVVRQVLGAFLGADPEDLALVPNATAGVNSVLRSLELAPGDEIVVTSHGYNACNNTVALVCERSGAVQRTVAIPFPIASADEVVAAIEAACGERTKLVLVDHVTSPTGLVLPVERLVPRLRERGIRVLVDGAHAPGMLPLDLDALGADYWTGNLHKWCCTPKGSAVLHVRRDRQAEVTPWLTSHGRNAPLDGMTRFRAEFEWTGTVDPTAWLCVPVALEFLGSLVPDGWDGIRRRNHALALEARDLLCEALDCAPPAPDDMLGALAAVELPGDAPPTRRSAFEVDPLQKRLYEEHRIEVPVMPSPAGPRRLLRISAALHNSRDQYERLVRVLPGLVGR